MNSTRITALWLDYNNYWHLLAKFESVADVKRWVKLKMGNLNEKQIKGLQTVNWHQIYQLAKQEA